MTGRSPRLTVALSLLCGLSASAAHAQCTPAWQAMGNGVGTGSDFVYALARLSNGNVVAGGRFSFVGVEPASNIAMWNGSTWSPIGAGTNETVYSIAQLPSGDIVIAGEFNSAGGSPAARLARWNGSSWISMNSDTRTIGLTEQLVLPNGDLVVGGCFTGIGGVTATGIARWNGSTWAPYGPGLGTNSQYVMAIATDSGGNLLAGGNFTATGGSFIGAIARWNGASWTSLGTPLTGSVFDILTMPNGDLIVAGSNMSSSGSGPLQGIARWNGSSWSRVGSGIPGSVYELMLLPDNSLAAVGFFETAGGSPAHGIARWDGSAWSTYAEGFQFGGAPGSMHAITTDSAGAIIAGGNFITAGTVDTRGVGRWAPVNTIQISSQPQPAASCPTGSTPFSVAATGSGTLTYQWQIQTAPDTWLNLSSLPVSLPCGGAASAAPVADTSISVSPCAGVNQYSVRCIVDNACTSTASQPAVLIICRADFNCDRATDFFDYLDFVAAFADNAPSSDFNADGVIDFFDYLDFVAAFSTGC